MTEYASLDAAWEQFAADVDDPYFTQEASLNLANFTTGQLRDVADAIDNICCGYSDRVVTILGEPWFLSASYGH